MKRRNGRRGKRVKRRNRQEERKVRAEGKRVSKTRTRARGVQNAMGITQKKKKRETKGQRKRR